MIKVETPTSLKYFKEIKNNLPMDVVTFDFHDTLVFMKKRDYEIISEYTNVPTDICRENWRIVEQRLQIARQKGEWPPQNQNDWLVKLYDLYLKELGVQASSAILVEKVHDLFSSSASYALFPETKYVLDILKKSGLSIGILSNTDIPLLSILNDLGIGSYTDSALSSRTLGIEKPSKQPFSKIIENLQSSFEKTIHVGDNIEENARGAANAGMHPILISRQETNLNPESYLFPVITDLKDLFTLLEIRIN